MLRDRRNCASVVRSWSGGASASFRKLAERLAHCLESPDYLPFWGDAYRIRQAPWTSFGRLDCPTIYLDLMPPEWEPGKAGNHFGTLNVTITPENDAIVIDEICTRYKGPVPSVPERSRVGCELVRRVLSFAADIGMRRVQTTHFFSEAVCFWFGHGFAPLSPVAPDWQAIGDETQRAYWQEEFGRSREALWRFAQAPFGPKALKKYNGKGEVDLQDAAQRRYVANRLKLDETALLPMG